MRRFFAYPITWMLVGAAAIIAADGVFIGGGMQLGTVGSIVGPLLAVAAGLGLYRLVMHYLARREMPELRGARETFAGALLGFGFLVTSFLIVYALGGFSIVRAPDDAVRTVVLAVVLNLGAAVCEELAFRGMLLQGIAKLGGPIVAVAITALLFGGVHLANAGATLWSSLAIAVEAGVLMGCAFVWRRNLWFVIGLHWAWNTTEMLLGIPVSGHREPSVWLTTVHGNAWLTGGDFGIEASVVPVILGAILSALIVWRRDRDTRRKGDAPGHVTSPG
ncbi:MAG TPA: CPBP family intramembrane glutamic endopeptidase [Kofleriaceae bacterium]